MQLQKNVSLKNYSTFKIGGPAKYFCECKSLDELKEALKWAGDNNENIFVLGGGSNILFSDEGFDGLVIRIMNSELRIEDQEYHKNPLSPPLTKGETGRFIIICGAGVSLARLVNFSVGNNLTGLEWAVGIPGTVGGAVRGNAGAFGGEIKKAIKNVRVINIPYYIRDLIRNGELNKTQNSKLKTQNYNSKLKTRNKKFELGIANFSEKEMEIDRNSNYQVSIINCNNKQCQFGYRESIFKQNKNLIIWEVELELQKGDKKTSENKIREILLKRKENQPLEYPSVGSIFKNPVVSSEIIKQFEEDKEIKCKDDKVPVGWLIESCGLKGKKIGGVQISEKQANFIINTGNAKAEDVIILISLIKQKVRNHFGVQLQEEIEIVF